MIYNIPAGTSFFDVLARWVLEKDDIANILILLPSRRNCKALRDAFLRATDGRPLLLPQIFPIHAVENIPALAEFAATLPSPISPLYKKAELARLIQKATPNMLLEQALNLSDELSGFLDEMMIYGVDDGALANIVPDELAAHWQKTLRFLELVSMNWRGVLREKGLLDNTECQLALLEKLTQTISESPDRWSHIIAAGHKVHTPHLEELLRTINGLKHGSLCFAALETCETKQEKLPPTHPQYSLHYLLHSIAETPVYTTLGNTNSARAHLLQEALKPAADTASWGVAKLDVPTALEGLSFASFANLEEEAAGIALMLRKCLEEKGKTALCITPDRHLARRVVAQMRRFGVELNDSGGTPIAQLPQTVFLRLLAEVIASDFAPVPLLALLKHPLCTCGVTRQEVLDKTRELEKAHLRGVRPSPEIIATEFAFLYERISDFAALRNEAHTSFHTLLKSHIQAAENIAENLWEKDEGEAVAECIREALEVEMGAIAPEEYLGIFEALLEGKTFRPKFGFHPRINILGTIEANLQTADMVIVAGLNEGVFPSYTSSGIWLNNSMRDALGLPSRDEKIGLSAHDFYMLACNKEVILTRSQKIDGVETIPSRWWLRLETLLAMHHASLPKNHPWAGWCRLLDMPEAREILAPTEANPPLDARPKHLSVTQIDTLMRDPYSIYASKILALKKLDDIDQELTVADFGNAVHKALELFVKQREDRYEALLACGRTAFGNMLEKPLVNRFWWSRFERIATWWYAQHTSRNFSTIAAEKKLLLEGLGDINFTLKGKADRIEETPQGTVIADYKTGTLPSDKNIAAGLSSQLLLLALMVAKNGGKPCALEYWKLSGKQDQIRNILNKGELKNKDISEILLETEAQLTEIIHTFFATQTPFLACPNMDNAPRYNDYAHLERVKEWE